MAYSTNSDGLVLAYGTSQGALDNIGSPKQAGADKRIVYEFTYADLAAFGTTNYILGRQPQVFVPAGALLRSAVLIVTGLPDGTGATLDLGFAKNDGTEVDYDGIDAAILESDLDAGVGTTITCDGVLIGTILAYDSYLSTNVNTASFTAGKFRLELTYFVPSV